VQRQLQVVLQELQLPDAAQLAILAKPPKEQWAMIVSHRQVCIPEPGQIPSIATILPSPRSAPGDDYLLCQAHLPNEIAHASNAHDL